jgi:hypothetical protein
MTAALAGVSVDLAMVARAANISGGGLALPFVYAKDRPTFNFSRSTFLPHLNSTFRVHLNNISSVDIELVKVTDDLNSSPSKANTFKTKSYSLDFTASGHSTFPSGSFLMEHVALGKFLLFISPVSLPGKPARYQAVINHLHSD